MKTFSILCVKQEILSTLSYFDIFDYPLTQTEIAQFLQASYSHQELIEGLYQLSADNWIYRFDDVYMLHNNYTLALRRRQGNAMARSLLQKAERIAAFLSTFPFVKGVAISGSLSKNFADDRSDIDFFIIAEKNKLWLARTAMHLFKKFTFLSNKQDWFCMNYYIDEAALTIKEKNIYTATEVATLLPLRGIEIFSEFFQANLWTRQFLPNHSLRISYVQAVNTTISKRVFEFLLRNWIGNLLDMLLMHITSVRWKQKTKAGKTDKKGVVLRMECSRNFAKPHHLGFQQKFMDLYEKKIFNLFSRYQSKVKTVF